MVMHDESEGHYIPDVVEHIEDEVTIYWVIDPKLLNQVEDCPQEVRENKNQEYRSYSWCLSHYHLSVEVAVHLDKQVCHGDGQPDRDRQKNGRSDRYVCYQSFSYWVYLWPVVKQYNHVYIVKVSNNDVDQRHQTCDCLVRSQPCPCAFSREDSCCCLQFEWKLVHNSDLEHAEHSFPVKSCESCYVTDAIS